MKEFMPASGQDKIPRMPIDLSGERKQSILLTKNILKNKHRVQT